MSDNFSNPSKLIVAVFSRPSALSLELIKQILENSCLVTLISDDLRNWKKYLSNIDNKGSIKLLRSSQSSSVTCNYLVFTEFCSPSKITKSTFRNVKKNVDKAIEISKNNSAKTLFVLPYVQEDVCHQKTLSYLKLRIRKEKISAGTVFIGHVLGKDAFFSEDNLLTQTLKNAADSNKLNFPKKEMLFYPIRVKAASKHLVKSLFSFGAYGSSTALISKPLRSKTLFKYLTKLKPELSIKNYFRSRKYSSPTTPKTDEVKKLHGNLEIIVGEYFKNLLKLGGIESSKSSRRVSSQRAVSKSKVVLTNPKTRARGFAQRQTKSKEAKSKTQRKNTTGIRKLSGGTIRKPKSRAKTHLSRLLILLAITLLLPFVLIVINLSMLVFGVNNLKNGNFSMAEKTLSVSAWTGRVANTFFETFEKIPVIGTSFGDLRRTTQILVKVNQMGKSCVVLGSLSSELIDKVRGDDIYDLDNYSNRISLELDCIYKELGFLQSEIVSTKIGSSLLKAKGVEDGDISKIREKLLHVKKLTNELPHLLGIDKEMVYLVLLQNNMELRPAGGFIDSFALIKFDKGRLVNIDVQDVYFADGQLKGYVEPPFPIKRYLGEANWFLRDSNWDPDFPTSAKQAQWFLDKEIGVLVNGVVGTDFELTKDLLEVTGQVALGDFEKEIAWDNLYEIVQTEVEENFFHGSSKKVNFATTLSKIVLERVINLPSEQQVDVAQVCFNNLEEKHIQIFLSNTYAQKAISSLGWSGELASSSVKNNLFADWVGMVEANLGVNKQNYYVKRSAKMEIDLKEGKIERKLSIIIENSFQDASETAKRYKAYLRVMVPAGNIFGPVEISKDGEGDLIEAEVNNVREHIEAGVLVEVFPKEKKQIQFTWTADTTLDFTNNGTYLMFWRKQAGTLNDPILISYDFPQGLAIESSPLFTLTGPDIFGYNTELSRDFVSQIYW